MTPHLSYRIWHTQRSGSTLLCEAIKSTGIAGQPGEHFNIDLKTTLLEHYEAVDYEGLKRHLWQIGSTSNGVFGVKNSMHHTIYSKLFKEVLGLRAITAPHPNHETIWSDIFPNCKHLYMTRRNKVRLAVSWWKAIQDEVWHLQKGEKRTQKADFYGDKYNFDALSHLFKEANLREAALQEYFDRHNIAAFTIIYEDFIKDYEGTVLSVLECLGLETAGVKVAPKALEKTADAHSEEWVLRFRDDLQKGMEERRIW